MNKRQEKKNYKKLYGYNPPSRRQRQAAAAKVYKEFGLTEEYGLTPEQIEAITKGSTRAFEIFKAAFADAAETIGRGFIELGNSLRESEDKTA